MPSFIIAAAVSTAVSGVVASVLTGVAFAFSWTAFAGSLVLGGLSRMMQKQPSTPSASSLDYSAQTRSVSVRQPAAPWTVVFGEVRIGGVVVFMHTYEWTHPGDHQLLQIVLALSGHELEEIGDLYLSDELVPVEQKDAGVIGVAGTFWQSYEGKYASRVQLMKHLGASDQLADASLIRRSNGKWTAAHRMRGRGYAVVCLAKADSLFPQGIPNITLLCKGYKEVYDPRDGGTRWTQNPALLVAAYLTNSSFGMGCDYATEIDEDELISSANICDEQVSALYTPSWSVAAGSPNEGLINFSSSQIQIQSGEAVLLYTSSLLPNTSSGRLSTGVLYYFIRISDTQGKLARTLSDALAGTAIALTDSGAGTHTMAARRVVASLNRTTATLTMEVSEKRIRTGDAIRFEVVGGSPGYLPGGSPGGLSAGTTYYAVLTGDKTMKVATSYLNALARNTIELSVAGSGTLVVQLYSTPRYTCNGTFLTSQAPKEIIEQLVSSMSGKAINTGGRWRIVAGAYVSPTTPALDPGEFRGPIEISALIPRADNANGIKGIFVSPENHWQPTDFPPVSNSTYQEEDSGELIWKDVQLPFTTRTGEARRHALIELNRIRQSLTLKVPCMLSAYRFQVGDTLELTWDRYGFVSKAFEVIEGNLVIGEDGRMGYDMVLRETAAAVYSWDASYSAHLDIAPNTILPTSETMQSVVPPRVSGLTLFGDDSGGNEFVGRDAKFVWRKNSSFAPELGAEISGSLSPGKDEYFKDFECKVYGRTGSPSTDWELLRTDYVLDPKYEYTGEKNAEDNAGVPIRSFKLEVRQRTLFGKRSALPAEIIVSNPVPDAPTGLTLAAKINGFSATADRPTDTDYAGMVVHASTSNGFTPSAANRVYKGKDFSAEVLGLTPSQTYYVKVAFFDDYYDDVAATDTLNYSAQSSITTLQVQTVDIVTNGATRIISSSSDGEITQEAYIAGSPEGSDENIYHPVLKSLSYTTDGVNPGTPFLSAQVRVVRATDGEGVGDDQYAICVTTSDSPPTTVSGLTFDPRGGSTFVRGHIHITGSGLTGTDNALYYLGDGYPLVLTRNVLSDTEAEAMAISLNSSGPVTDLLAGLPNGATFSSNVTRYMGGFSPLPIASSSDLVKTFVSTSGQDLGNLIIAGNGNNSQFTYANVYKTLFLIGPSNSSFYSNPGHTFSKRVLTAFLSKR